MVLTEHRSLKTLQQVIKKNTHTLYGLLKVILYKNMKLVLNQSYCSVICHSLPASPSYWCQSTSWREKMSLEERWIVVRPQEQLMLARTQLALPDDDLEPFWLRLLFLLWFFVHNDDYLPHNLITFAFLIIFLVRTTAEKGTTGLPFILAPRPNPEKHKWGKKFIIRLWRQQEAFTLNKVWPGCFIFIFS